VYLPPGKWIDYQTGRIYPGGWHRIKAGDIPVVVLVKNGAVIPHIKLAQSTAFMDWSSLELVVYNEDEKSAVGLVCLPTDQKLHEIKISMKNEGLFLANDPLIGKVKWLIRKSSQ
jgi:alpha-D-xyloside xylohydrolase